MQFPGYIMHTINDQLCDAALISVSLLKVQHLFESGVYFNYGQNTEGNIESIK